MTISTSGRILVMLGRPSSAYEQAWKSHTRIRGFVSLPSAAPLGRRFGKRALGLGVDSARVALKAALLHPRGDFIANNPWVGLALCIIGRRPVAVLGVYAKPGSSSFRLLRRILGDTVVVCTVSIEAESWRAAGGRAEHVLYGAQFDYPTRATESEGPLRIFIGGSSDRDVATIQRLESEIEDHPEPIDLVIATGGPASQRSTCSGGTVKHLPSVSQKEFGAALASADVAFLPLRATGRAAGHMVAVGALQVGVPVVTTRAPGMTGYIDGEFVISVSDTAPLLPALTRQARVHRDDRERIRRYWAERHSLQTVSRAVLEAIDAAEMRAAESMAAASRPGSRW